METDAVLSLHKNAPNNARLPSRLKNWFCLAATLRCARKQPSCSLGCGGEQKDKALKAKPSAGYNTFVRFFSQSEISRRRKEAYWVG